MFNYTHQKQKKPKNKHIHDGLNIPELDMDKLARNKPLYRQPLLSSREYRYCKDYNLDNHYYERRSGRMKYDNSNNRSCYFGYTNCKEPSNSSSIKNIKRKANDGYTSSITSATLKPVQDVCVVSPSQIIDIDLP